MIHYIKGDLLESPAQALVNTVNTVGVMGKGIALQFKKMFPQNFKTYQKQCKDKQLNIGDLLIVEDENILTGKKLIINFPTKTHWRKPSEYEYIEKGLEELQKAIHDHRITSVAIPALGSGNGGLHWENVRQLIENHLADLDTDIYIYEPNHSVKEVLKKERVKLTPARAMLVYMLFRLVRNGEFVSEFAAEKICYFLQRFGAAEHFKLAYKKHFYGPYSGKVRHILGYLNGSYITGYDAKDKKPFEPLNIVADSEAQVLEYIAQHPDLKEITRKTDEFLTGFYADYPLELLSSMDYIIQEKQSTDKAIITAELEQWSDRKRTLAMNEKHLDIVLGHLVEAEFVAHVE